MFIQFFCKYKLFLRSELLTMKKFLASCREKRENFDGKKKTQRNASVTNLQNCMNINGEFPCRVDHCPGKSYWSSCGSP